MRPLVQVLLPLIAPTLLFLAYAWYMRRRAVALGHPEPPPWTQGPWGWLILAGALLSAGSLVALFGDAQHESGRYTPAKAVDGRIVPGHVDPSAPMPPKPAP
jgi:hypothetical protein